MPEFWAGLAFIVLPTAIASMRAFGAWDPDIAIALAGCWGAMLLALVVGGWWDRLKWRRRLSRPRG